VDTEPRKDLVITFAAEGVKIGLSPAEALQKREYDQGLSSRMRPERVHILDL
jgi:hypothetical protein